jgi:spermidine synthase
MRRAPQGQVIYRGREILVFRRGGYRGFVFKSSPNLIQGWQNITEPLDFRSEFVELQLAATMCVPRPRRVAVLGLGLGTVPRTLRCMYPPVEIEAVEIRSEVVSVAKRYFGLMPDALFGVTIADAGEWVKQARHKRYDAVYVDLYSDKGLSDVAKQEDFMFQLSRIVRPGGLLSFNLIGSRKVNELIATHLAGVTRSVWTISGVRKSNVALFGIKEGRVDPALALKHAQRIDRREVLPFRLNGHVRRMERLYI